MLRDPTPGSRNVWPPSRCHGLRFQRIKYRWRASSRFLPCITPVQQIPIEREYSDFAMHHPAHHSCHASPSALNAETARVLRFCHASPGASNTDGGRVLRFRLSPCITQRVKIPFVGEYYDFAVRHPAHNLPLEGEVSDFAMHHVLPVILLTSLLGRFAGVI